MRQLVICKFVGSAVQRLPGPSIACHNEIGWPVASVSSLASDFFVISGFGEIVTAGRRPAITSPNCVQLMLKVQLCKP